MKKPDFHLLEKLFHMSLHVSLIASLFSLITLSIDRYIAIKFAKKRRINFIWKKSWIISFIIWILSLSVPFLSKGWSNWLFNDFYQYSCCNSSSYINCYIYSCSQVSQSLNKKKKRNNKNYNNCKHDGESQKKISTSKSYQNLSMGFSCISNLLFCSSNFCLHRSVLLEIRL